MRPAAALKCGAMKLERAGIGRPIQSRTHMRRSTPLAGAWPPGWVAQAAPGRRCRLAEVGVH
jgi:hypothetical protein